MAEYEYEIIRDQRTYYWRLWQPIPETEYGNGYLRPVSSCQDGATLTLRGARRQIRRTIRQNEQRLVERGRIPSKEQA